MTGRSGSTPTASALRVREEPCDSWRAARPASPELRWRRAVRPRRAEGRARGERVVHAVVVGGAAVLVGARLGHDVDEAAQGPAVLGQVGAVEDAELPHRLLGGRGTRQAGVGLHVVDAVDLDEGVQLLLAAEAEAGRGRGPDTGVGLLERPPADVLAAEGDAARELHEVHEVPADVRQRLDLALAHDAGEVGLGGLDEDLARRNRHLRPRSTPRMTSRTAAPPTVSTIPPCTVGLKPCISTFSSYSPAGRFARL